MCNRLVLILCVGWGAQGAGAFVRDDEAGPRSLNEQTLAFIESHCLRCHKGERPKGKLDLTQFRTTGSMSVEPKRWGRIIARVEAGEMPPVGSKPPGADERARFLADVKQ